MSKITLSIALSGILCAGVCHAEGILIQRTATGYLIMLQTPTGKHCWGMPKRLDLSYIPDKPMDIEAAAARYKWKNPTSKQMKLCKRMENITWKVYENQDQKNQPVYKVTLNNDMVKNHITNTVIDHINSNSQCGGYIHNYGISDDLTWRQVIGNKGKQGAALCKEYP